MSEMGVNPLSVHDGGVDRKGKARRYDDSGSSLHRPGGAAWQVKEWPSGQDAPLRQT